MKLKVLSAATLLLAAGGAYAAPTLQTCSPMEVTHTGAAGLSYVLACNAGDWALTYTGSVPAGVDAVTAHYRLQASNSDGSHFTQSRDVRLPSPAMLGQALLREAVVLESGSLALRDCPDFGCTLYRPLGNVNALAKATVTVTPELKRLTDETSRLSNELGQRRADLAVQTGKVATLEEQLKDLSAKLEASEKARAGLQASLDSAKADLKGLMTSSKADQAKAVAAEDAKAGVNAVALTVQLNNTVQTLEQTRKELADCMAAHKAAEDAKAKADAQVEALTSQIGTLQSALDAARANLAQAHRDGYFTEQQVNAIADTTGAMAKLRLQLDAANGKVTALTEQVADLQQKLNSAQSGLAAAQQAQANHAAAVATAEKARDGHQADLAAALKAAQDTIAKMTSANEAQLNDLHAQLDAANKKLAAASVQPVTGQQAVKVDGNSNSPLGLAQAKLMIASAKVDQLNARVAELEHKLADAHTQVAPAASTDTVKTADVSSATSATAPAASPEAAEELASLTKERDAAVAQVGHLSQALAAVQPRMTQLQQEHDEAVIGAKKVATEMLAAVDKIRELQKDNDAANKALKDSTNKMLELSTKFQAADMARNLAMQAVSAANADADTQHMKMAEVQQKLAQAEDQLKACATQPAQVAPNAAVDLSIPAMYETLGTMVQQNEQLQRQVDSQTQRANSLAELNSAQTAELKALRAKLARLEHHGSHTVKSHEGTAATR
ncbi:hypothetical protein KTD31_03630 [Burkholderia multivorans]|uniref:hypothetical protein n=1 Tax=Burkholderia multivorans TaxID=87883 RepID=UPI001C2433D4|nr:hypothetical protein [Burkholderia multivorans]MBU9200445.1 hypothetical protein [Burkholderia multivorans]MDN8078430.1 hypothetical protein [Burkholderia multivorans]